MPAERFDFPNAQGQRLAALLDRPAGEARACALFAHCFTCGKDVHAARRIAEGLSVLGVEVLRFDFTGIGGSEGESAIARRGRQRPIAASREAGAIDVSWASAAKGPTTPTASSRAPASRILGAC